MPNWKSFETFLEDAEQASNNHERQRLVNALLTERSTWPWVEDRKATFVYMGADAKSAALNMDIFKGDPPFAPMTNLTGTTLWYVTHEFAPDDLLDYMLAINDPMTPLADDPNVVNRVARHWHSDPLNPLSMQTGQMEVSVMRMNAARPFPDWSAMSRVPHGRIFEHTINSAQLGFTGRKLWVYTPPGYESSPDTIYPLLVLEDGQWAVGPLQVPYITDALIKHKRIEPLVIAMKQSGDQQERIKTYISNDRHYTHILTEVLPFVQTQYRIDATNLGIGGVAVSAVAAAHAALRNPAVFSALVMVSPPLGKGAAQEALREYARRFDSADVLPRRIFQSVGRYETRSRFYKPALELRAILSRRRDIYYQFVEVGSGHGLVGFRSVFPEALAWSFPGVAAVG